ncbi:MAG: T9SS type A sorting domain-containing protein [Bacteroidetes bacterium]|nr:T9SS type A sorting domain-containing protein [Bacteroidota bacterium]
MKKYIFLALVLLSVTSIQAKKVKFAVDMNTFTISPNGIHLMSDFQSILGLTGGDWQPNTLALIQEGSSTIYSVIVDIPAFTKYEFKFVNGTFGYEAEFVPDQSRVGYSFNDNRWLYVDSLKNDTTFVGAIPFSGNAPAGKKLIRFLVDMSNETSVSSNGVHVAGNFQTQTWNTKNNILYSFGGGVYEVIAYAPSGNYEFKYYNGNTAGDAETVPSACATNNNRTHNLIADTILPTVCYKACVTCNLASVYEYSSEIRGIKMYPNPLVSSATLEFKDKGTNYEATIMDLSGRVLQTYNSSNGENIEIKRDDLKSGIYLVRVINSQNAKSTSKLIIQ